MSKSSLKQERLKRNAFKIYIYITYMSYTYCISLQLLFCDVHANFLPASSHVPTTYLLSNFDCLYFAHEFTYQI